MPDREATVATFSKTWLDHVAHRVKPITLKRYRELLAVHVIPTIGPVRMTELRPAGVQATIDKVLQRRSPRTAVNTYRAVSERLGHASTSFTMDTYSAEIPSKERAAADAADTLFGEGREADGRTMPRLWRVGTGRGRGAATRSERYPDVHRWCGERVKGNPEWIASPADVERMMERINRRIENG